MNPFNRSIGVAVLLVLVLAPSGWGQSDTARIVGTVMDKSGASVSGAAVVAVNTKTNERTQVTSQADGSFVITPLRVGTYTLEATVKGFRKFVKPDISLDVNEVARIDVELEVGQVTEAITVSGGAPLVETETSSLGQVINDRNIVSLPLNGRNFTQLATLVPGVNRGVPGSNADGSGGNAETFRQGETGSAAISANGLREQNNNFQLDGIDNNESIVNTIVFFPPVEALQEFRVITTDAPAEFGRGGGAIINAVIKSGANSYHGSLFEFIRNSALDAQPTFAVAKPLFIRNQFGGTFGGPIIHDKTFFFVDYQGLRQRLPIEAGNRVTVPTQLMRKGDFSELLNTTNPTFTGVNCTATACDSILIYSPFTGNPYPNNVITDPLNPVAVAYLNSYPLPDLTDRAQGNFFVRRLRRQTFDDGDIRLDHRFSERDVVFVRYSDAEDRQFDPGRIPGFQAGFGAGTNQIIAHSAAANYTRTFTSSLVNELRFGYVKQRIEFLPVNFGTDQTKALNIGGLTGISTAEVGGITLIGGGDGRFIEYLGDGGPYKLNERTIQVSDALSWVRGRHTLKFGATFLQRHIGSLQADLGKGFYFFDDFTATSGKVPAAGRTGYEVSDMLIGRTAFTTAAMVTPTTAISYENGFYAQDDWRVSRRLTLNLGLRYEVFIPPYEVDNKLANYDPTTQTLVVPGTGIPRSAVNTDWNNFGPRLGFAYDVRGNGKTVVRAAYGVFYALDRAGIANQLTQNPPFNTEQFRFDFGAVTSAGIADGGQLQLSDPIPAAAAVNPSSPSLPLGSKVRFIPLDTQNTRVQQYSLSIQREFTSNLAFDIAYVGTNGANVTAVTTQGGFGGSITGLITTIANVGVSHYNSLQVKLTQRAATTGALRGLGYLTAYTWGKATNNSPGAFPGIGGAFRQTPTDPNGLSPGLADYDVSHRFTFAGTYDILFFRDSEGVKRAVLNGWQTNMIITLQKGSPFSVFDGGCGRAKLIGDPNQGGGTANMWFNTAAFTSCTSPADQSGRNILRAPGIADVDFSLFRRFGISENIGIEFRSEFFDLFNHQQLGFPNNFCCGGDFGKITTTRLNTERQIQFGLRFTF